MADDLERPEFPWARIVVAAAVVVVALSVFGWIIHTIWSLIRMAAIIVVLVAVVAWAIGSKADRQSSKNKPSSRF